MALFAVGDLVLTPGPGGRRGRVVEFLPAIGIYNVKIEDATVVVACLEASLRRLLPDGTLPPVARFAVGDLVLTPNGRKGRVVSAPSPPHTVYEVKIENNGAVLDYDDAELRSPMAHPNGTPPPDVTFTREGGFTFNGNGENPYVPLPLPKPKPPPTAVRAFADISRWFQSYGKEVLASESRHDTILSSVANVGFSKIDQGSLLRIAAATEEQSESTADLVKEMRAFRKEMKEMMKFWKELRTEYQKQKGIDDGD